MYDAVTNHRCFACNFFNHTSKQCNKPNSSPKCGANDKVAECTARELSVNCILGKSDNPCHAIWDVNCPVYMRAVDRMKNSQTHSSRLISSHNDEFLMFYQNCHGLNTKSDIFYMSVSESEYDLIRLTETWLRASFSRSELFPDNYNVLRCDRKFAIVEVTRGGLNLYNSCCGICSSLWNIF